MQNGAVILFWCLKRQVRKSINPILFNPIRIRFTLKKTLPERRVSLGHLHTPLSQRSLRNHLQSIPWDLALLTPLCSMTPPRTSQALANITAQSALRIRVDSILALATSPQEMQWYHARGKDLRTTIWEDQWLFLDLGSIKTSLWKSGETLEQQLSELRRELNFQTLPKRVSHSLIITSILHRVPRARTVSYPERIRLLR